jgi:tRNA pseudouridine55 synthase
VNAAAQRTIPEDIVCPTTCRPTSLDDGTAFLVDKPTGCTSHDVVRAVRRATDRKKVGHAGTLDPLATGLLIILVARPATRLQAAFTNLPKTYTTTVRLGETTPSHDAETDVAATADVSHLSRADVEVAAKAFEGVIDQVPPMYSAVRIDGERLYKKARRGETVDRPPRQVRIDDIEILDGNVPTVTLRVQCSKGTYIRSLARDLGAALNVGAHLLALRRTAIGPYAVEDAWTLDVLLDALA